MCVSLLLIRVLQPGDRHALRGPWRYKDSVNLPLRGHFSYPETTNVVSAHLYQQWTDHVATGSLAGAEALISSGSEWGKMMTRAITFADMS